MKEILNKIGKIISSAIFIILLLIIFLVIGYLIKVKVYTNQNRLDEIRLNFYTIISQSMSPTIKAGDIVITYKNLDKKYNTNDIITFVSTSGISKGAIITHRIKEIYSLDGVNAYKTKGDYNNTSDSSLVPEENVVGKVVFKIPKAGYIQQFLVTGPGWIIAIVIPCLGIIIFDIVKLVRRTGKKELEKIKEWKQSKTTKLSVVENESIKSENETVSNNTSVSEVKQPEIKELVQDNIKEDTKEIPVINNDLLSELEIKKEQPEIISQTSISNNKLPEELEQIDIVSPTMNLYFNNDEVLKTNTNFDKNSDNQSVIEEASRETEIEMLDEEPINRFEALRKDNNGNE